MHTLRKLDTLSISKQYHVILTTIYLNFDVFPLLNGADNPLSKGIFNNSSVRFN